MYVFIILTHLAFVADETFRTLAFSVLGAHTAVLTIAFALTEISIKARFALAGDIEAGAGLGAVGVRGAFSFYWLHELASTIISTGAGWRVGIGKDE